MAGVDSIHSVLISVVDSAAKASAAAADPFGTSSLPAPLAFSARLVVTMARRAPAVASAVVGAVESAACNGGQRRRCAATDCRATEKATFCVAGRSLRPTQRQWEAGSGRGRRPSAASAMLRLQQRSDAVCCV